MDHSSDSLRNQYIQLDYFKKAIKPYQGLDEEAEKYIEKVKSFIDKPIDEIEKEDIREVRKKTLVRFPPKFEVSVFYGLTGRFLHEELEFNERDLIIHVYNTFISASRKVFGKLVRYRVNIFYHLLRKIGKEPNADMFPLMKGDSHQRIEEEIKFVFDHLGWDYIPIELKLG